MPADTFLRGPVKFAAKAFGPLSHLSSHTKLLLGPTLPGPRRPPPQFAGPSTAAGHPSPTKKLYNGHSTPAMPTHPPSPAAYVYLQRCPRKALPLFLKKQKSAKKKTSDAISSRESNFVACLHRVHAQPSTFSRGRAHLAFTSTTRSTQVPVRPKAKSQMREGTQMGGTMTGEGAPGSMHTSPVQ